MMLVLILNASSIRWGQLNSLVQFLGMIQDMLGNEFYVGAYKDGSVWRTNKFMDVSQQNREKCQRTDEDFDHMAQLAIDEELQSSPNAKKMGIEESSGLGDLFVSYTHQLTTAHGVFLLHWEGLKALHTLL